MSEENKESEKNEYIGINLSKMFMGFFISIYKNVKSFIIVLIIGCLFTLIFTVFLSRPDYAYKQMIDTPSYFNGKTENNILSNTRINVILQSKLKQIQEKDHSNALLQQVQILYLFYDYQVGSDNKDKKIIKNDNFNLKQQYDQQTMFFTLFVASKESDNKEVSKLYDDLLKQFSESTVIQKDIALWKKSLETKLRLTTENLSRNENLLKKNQQYLMDLINKQTNFLGMDSQSQSMILKYIGNIDGYQNKIFSLQDSIALTKVELDNIEPQLSGFSDTYTVKGDVVSKVKILLVGFFLSLLAAVIFSLTIDLFRKVAVEARKV